MKQASADAATSPDPASTAAATHRLDRVLLAADHLGQRSGPLVRDVQQALLDLAADADFRPRGLRGPFILRMSLAHGRLVLDIRDAADAPLAAVGLALGPFRRLVKDYLLVVDNHADAAENGRDGRLEAIDMGRRALHNEGAALVQQRLAGKIELDDPTARRLFTLICVLQQRF